MNYRHAYHAGNFADVFKHGILALIIEALKEKPAPFAVLDTHAGVGLYDLTSEQAQKTKEHETGVLRLLAAGMPPLLAPYAEVLRRANPAGPVRFYPGSPWLVRALLRPEDRLVLSELHPEDVETLRGHFRHDRQVAVHHQDAYLALKAFLPPKEKRGLVLVDPPFERTDEFAALAAGIEEAYARFRGGIYALWYPIKDLPPVTRFHRAMESTGIRKVLAAELILHTPRADALCGCGFVFVNPPWKLESQLKTLLPELFTLLGGEKGGRTTLRWLAGE